MTSFCQVVLDHATMGHIFNEALIKSVGGSFIYLFIY